MKKVFIPIGRTNSGKTSIFNKVSEELNLKILKSYTTRKKRESDKQKSDHIFILPNEVNQYKHEMAAYAKTDNNEYFSTLSQLYESDIYTLNPTAIKNMVTKFKLENINDIEFVCIYIYSDQETRLKRAIERNDDLYKYHSRNDDESEEFVILENSHNYDYCIVNKNFDKTVEIVKSIINVENGGK